MHLYRRIILLSLTLLVLVSSTGMAVGMHLCGGELRDVTFFGAKADCPMEKPKAQGPACHAPKQTQDDGTCCQDHELQVKDLGDAFSHKVTTLNKTQQLKLFAVVKAVVLQFIAPETDLKPTYALYESPPLSRDIPLLAQSFLL